MDRRLSQIHPGEILEQDFLIPMDVTPYRLAKETKIDQKRISEIVRGKRSISADTALRFSRFFGNSAQFWINLQTHFDLEQKRIEIQNELKQIRKYRAS